ncbi:MAG: pitrilysin family protein [Deltaproteobacteria bacterium]|nr:pitrilysin family protein [Deltaproteobacteria bacterium]
MHMSRFAPILALAAALLAAPPVAARGGPPRYQDMVREEMLPNGLRVLLLEDHRAPIVSFQVWYRVGSRDEKLGKTGLAHLLEHMMFKGTPRFGPKTFSQTIGRSGGDDNAFTSRDATVYFENIASENIEVAVELEADRMAHLLLDSKAFLSERDVVTEERRLRTEDDPGSELAEQLNAAAFTAHPYMNPVIGWMGDVRRLDPEDARAFYKKYYRPSNATVIAVGDFDSKKMISLLKKHFGPLPQLPAPERPEYSEPEQQGARRVVLRRTAQLPIVYLSYHAPRLGDPDFAALDVLDGILSGGRSARLLQAMVFESGLATAASSSYDGLSIDPSNFLLYAQVFPGKTIPDVERALRAEMAKILDSEISASEIGKARTQIEASWFRAQDSMFYRGMLLGEFETTGSWRDIDDYIPAVRKVKASDIRRAAGRVFTENNETAAYLEPTAPVSGGTAEPHSGGAR